MSGRPERPTRHRTTPSPAARSASDVLSDVEVVIPTVGRPSLHDLLRALGEGDGPLPRRVVVVDDRSEASTPLLDTPLLDEVPARLRGRLVVRPSGGRGPAAARNTGWRGCSATWIAFLDDDVLPPADWTLRLAQDLGHLDPDVAGSQGRLHVPLPHHRPPTDWERNVAGLERARWATADLAYRRSVLEQVDGFDERFPRAYREDADLGVRIVAAGHRIVRGGREMVHPVRPTTAAVSIRMQAGNADDVLMRALHGRCWRRTAHVPAGRRPWHLATVAAGTLAVAGSLARDRRWLALGATTWLALTAELAWRRIAPGPRDRTEVRRMLWTSAVLPVAAVAQWVRGWVGLRARLRRPAPLPRRSGDRDVEHPRPAAPAAVLFDRDGTIVHDVPYNGDASLVDPTPGTAEAIAKLRRLGVPTGVVTNQSGVARGLITPTQVEEVNAEVDRLLGPFTTWQVCQHQDADGCDCRKPAAGMILRAAAELGVPASACVVIGDTGADVDAALAAGARPILVPNAVTRPEEVVAAPEVAANVADAVDLALEVPRPLALVRDPATP